MWVIKLIFISKVLCCFMFDRHINGNCQSWVYERYFSLGLLVSFYVRWERASWYIRVGLHVYDMVNA